MTRFLVSMRLAAVMALTMSGHGDAHTSCLARSSREIATRWSRVEERKTGAFTPGSSKKNVNFVGMGTGSPCRLLGQWGLS